MRRGVTAGFVAGVGAMAVAFVSCGECLMPPCPLPIALIVNVTGGTPGAPVTGAVVQVSGAIFGTIPCSTSCYVPGTAGTYNLDVTAPGFEALRRTVTVQGTNPSCGCPTVVPEKVTVALVPTSSTSRPS